MNETELQQQYDALLDSYQALQTQLQHLQQQGEAHQEPTALQQAPQVPISQPTVQHNNTLPSPDHWAFRTAVRLPPFWPANPELWFCQAEAQFALNTHLYLRRLRSILCFTSDSTRYYCVVAQLDTRWAATVQDIITDLPPDGQRYNRLNSELIRRILPSEEQRICQLLSADELGDRKPSQFLRHLRTLVGSSHISDNVLRSVWMQQLPAGVQAMLQVSPAATLDEAADIADKIMDVAPPTPVVSAVTSATAPPTSPTISAANKSSFTDPAILRLIERVEDLIRSTSCDKNGLSLVNADLETNLWNALVTSHFASTIVGLHKMLSNVFPRALFRRETQPVTIGSDEWLPQHRRSPSHHRQNN